MITVFAGVSQPWHEFITNTAQSKSTNKKSQQHPKEFPSGHPPQYYPGLAVLNFGVRKGSGVFNAVWPLTESKAV